MKSSTAELNVKEAHRIVGLLARGLDPADQSKALSLAALKRPEVIRALMAANDALRSTLEVGIASSGMKHEKPWTESDDDRLRLSISRRDTLNNVALRQRRSIDAITARLVELGVAGDLEAAKSLFGMMRYDRVPRRRYW
jgi:hypothetical protein